MSVYSEITESARRKLAARYNPGWGDFEEIPTDIETFIFDDSYLALRRDEVWPSVVDDLRELFSKSYNEAVLLQAIGAGKSFKSGIILVYQLYLNLCLKDPISYWGLARGSKIAYMNTATTELQARDVVFGEISARINNSPWFTGMNAPDPRVKSKLKFRKGQYILPGSSSESCPLGYNLFCAVIDEASYMKQPGVNTSQQASDQVAKIYNAIVRRRESRFGDNGLIVIISNPQHEGDFTVRKAQEAETNPRLFAKHRTLWEAKEYYKRGVKWSGQTFFDEGINMNVPIELKASWDKNKHLARRDFAAIPSAAKDPYFNYEQLRDIMAESDMSCPVRIFDDQGYPKVWHDWFKPERSSDYFMHIDLAETRCAAGIGMGHWSAYRTKAVLDYVLKIIAVDEKKINFEKIRGIILLMRQLGFRLRKVTYDGWQSKDSLQILEAKGIEADTLSVDRNLGPYDTFLSFVNLGQFDTYNNPELLAECRGLELHDGRKVVKPTFGSKDISDAAAGVCFHMADKVGVGRPLHKVVSNRKPISVMVRR